MITCCPFCERKVEITIVESLKKGSAVECSFCKKQWIETSIVRKKMKS